jgi:hypothetical protein
MNIEPDARKALLEFPIVGVRTVEGRPGGPNNDCVTLTLEDGRKIDVDAYSGGNMYVTVR